MRESRIVRGMGGGGGMTVQFESPKTKNQVRILKKEEEEETTGSVCKWPKVAATFLNIKWGKERERDEIPLYFAVVFSDTTYFDFANREALET